MLETGSCTLAPVPAGCAHPLAGARGGIASRLVQEAFRRSGAERVDVVTDGAADSYRSFTGKEWHGFRMYP